MIKRNTFYQIVHEMLINFNNCFKFVCYKLGRLKKKEKKINVPWRDDRKQPFQEKMVGQAPFQGDRRRCPSTLPMGVSLSPRSNLQDHFNPCSWADSQSHSWTPGMDTLQHPSIMAIHASGQLYWGAKMHQHRIRYEESDMVHSRDVQSKMISDRRSALSIVVMSRYMQYTLDRATSHNKMWTLKTIKTSGIR